MVTPQLAEAKAIEALSNPKGKANKILSVLSDRDLSHMAYVFAITDATNYQWLANVAENELDLRCSLNRKGNRARDDLVKITQGREEAKGALSSFKNSIQSFFQSGA